MFFMYIYLYIYIQTLLSLVINNYVLIVELLYVHFYYVHPETIILLIIQT